MKRLIILLFAVVSAAAMWADNYNDNAEVDVNGVLVDERKLDITITEHNGLYDVCLNDLAVSKGSSTTVIGNVNLKDIKPVSSFGNIVLLANQDVEINQGTQPVKMAAKIENGELIAKFSIDMTTSLSQVIDIRFGSNMLNGKYYHVPNGNFEKWHVASEGYIEPNAWHSFESASGSMASMAGHHITRSNNGRNNSKCVRIITTEEEINLGIMIKMVTANGTLTTGRMNCGSWAASDPSNNTFLDMSKTDKDGNGDPFYVELTHRPDSLVTWLQFNRVDTDPEHPWCVVSATVTDGTYYQEPEPTDAQYSNILCKALNHDIVATGGKWKRISIPFDYSSYPYGVSPKAILINASSNAYKGAGKAGDEVLLDDLTLIYNNRLRQLGVTGFSSNKFDYEVSNNIDIDLLKAIADGKESHVLKTEKPANDGKYIFVDVYSADLKSCNTYTIHCKTGTGIAVTNKATDAATETYYNLGGQRIAAPQHGKISIVRTSDGRTVKVANK